jgi:hypothetical protein
VTAERVDVEPRPAAAVRTGLPPGATVADLVAALTADRPAPKAAVPAQDRPRGTGSSRSRRAPAVDVPTQDRPRRAQPPRRRAAPVDPPAPVVPNQDRPLGAEPPRRPIATVTPPVPPQPRPPASRRPAPPPPDPPLTLFTHQQPSHELELDRGLCPARTRPPIGDDLSLFGLSRRSRSRVGSRVFALSFALVFGLIFVQMVVSILYP